MEKKEAEETGEICPECGAPLVIRTGKYGEFTACSNYPTCKYIKPKETSTICKCPACDGNIVEKHSKRGKIFYGCDNYPKCKMHIGINQLVKLVQNVEQCLLKKIKRLNVQVAHIQNKSHRVK
ncbi:MAG: topoisomerase DNA-binding C4 zinc finger domain-containing protein [Clostridium sp.]|nr:MAG: topoisomerase DNA-binding C4 zinc finger domain-containing protein [Clostridium sp.]